MGHTLSQRRLSLTFQAFAIVVAFLVLPVIVYLASYTEIPEPASAAGLTGIALISIIRARRR